MEITKLKPSVGRILHYRLTASDAEAINRRRTTHTSIRERLQAEPPAWPAGAQAHMGNPAEEGQVLPLVVVRVWSEDTGCLNGPVLLDGNEVGCGWVQVGEADLAFSAPMIKVVSHASPAPHVTIRDLSLAA